MVTLENQLEGAFLNLNIAPEHRESITNHLNILKKKDETTYGHSIRVGLLSLKIGTYMSLDPKALFFAGTLHDIGKVLIDPEILKKTKGFGKKDMAEMKKHPEYAYKILRGVHEFSAEIAVRHHKYQEEGYPKKLPKPKISFSENTKLMIDFLGRILSLADFYDALTSRENDKFGEKRKMSKQEAKKILLEKNRDQGYLIENLYKNRIFGGN